MKLIITLASCVIGSLSFALDTLPNGHWEGMGVAQLESGQKVNVTEKLTIKDNLMTAELTEGGKTIVYKSQANFTKNGFFALETTGPDGLEKGTGYCGSTWCHFESGGKFEMTMAFIGGQVYELSSETVHGTRAKYESELKKK